VPATRDYSPLITPVNDDLTRLKPIPVVDQLMAFTCRRLRQGFRQGGCNASCQRRSKNLSASNLLNSLKKSTHKPPLSLYTLAFGGQRSTQLSYRRTAWRRDRPPMISHLADFGDDGNPRWRHLRSWRRRGSRRAPCTHPSVRC